MSEYPSGSTAKVYYDIGGNETTLYQLVRSEPDWAQSRLVEGEKALAKLAALVKDVEDLKRKLFNEGVKNNSNVARVEFLEDKLKAMEVAT